MLELLKKSAMDQSRAIQNKEVSAVELTKASLDRIKSIDEKLGAFNSLTEETALETAKKVDEKVAKGETLGYIHANSNEKYLEAEEKMQDIIKISEEKIEKEPTIFGICR